MTVPNGIFYLVRSCGFGEKWCSWKTHYISSVCFSVLVNGNTSSFFSSSRVLRQGDPLSPFVFFIIMEALRECFLLLLIEFSLRLFFGV